MTFDPQHDYANHMIAPPVKDAVCECPVCLHAGVTHPPVLHVEYSRIDGKVIACRYLHGAELRQHLAAAQQFREIAARHRDAAEHAVVER